MHAVLATIGYCNPGIVYLLSGYSRTGCAHAVVCRDDKIVHDPSLTDAGIVGPHPDTGFFWISFVVPALAAVRQPILVEDLDGVVPRGATTIHCPHARKRRGSHPAACRLELLKAYSSASWKSAPYCGTA